MVNPLGGGNGPWVPPSSQNSENPQLALKLREILTYLEDGQEDKAKNLLAQMISQMQNDALLQEAMQNIMSQLRRAHFLLEQRKGEEAHHAVQHAMALIPAK